MTKIPLTHGVYIRGVSKKGVYLSFSYKKWAKDRSWSFFIKKIKNKNNIKIY